MGGTLAVKGSLIQKGDDRWLVRVYTGRRDPKGNPIQQSRTVHGGRRKAENTLAAMINQVNKQRLEDTGVGVTVARLLDRWMEHIARQRTPYTLASYRAKIDSRISPALGKTRIDRLTAVQLDRTYTMWLDQGLRPATVRQYHAILSAALHQAVKWRWIDQAPTKWATPPTVRRQPDSIPSVTDLRRLIVAAEASEGPAGVLATAIILAAVTGCRRGELCALRWSDVGDGVLTVARSLTALEKRTSEGETKTHQIRRLALDALGVAVIEARRAAQTARAVETEIPLTADPYLLSRHPRGDRPCLPDGLTHAFAALCARLGMPYHLHQLRHFAATTLIAEGVDVRTVAGRLGHSTPSLTLSTYAHAVAARDAVAAEILGQRVLGPV